MKCTTITVTIQPAAGSTKKHENLAKSFRQEVSDLSGEKFAQIFLEVE